MNFKKLLLSFLVCITAQWSYGQCLHIECPADIFVQSSGNCDAVVSYLEPVGLDTCNPFFNYTFTTAGATGELGPTQSQVDAEYNGTLLQGLVTVTNGVQYFVVPVSATYPITAIGAAGGGVSGGAGASMSGSFALTVGDTVLVVVGQEGLDPGDGSSTGGGGTFVVLVDRSSSTIMTSTGLPVTPLLIAGGGGGNPGTANADCDANITNDGNDGNGVNGSGTGGAAGNGGGISVTAGNNRGGAGGGFLTDGNRTGTCSPAGGESGSGFLNGANGGLAASCGTPNAGGFGGGGGSMSTGWRGSGGGGGYSGGGAGQTNSNATTHRAGGGGSFNSGLSPNNMAGVGTGAGSVLISLPGNPTTSSLISGLGSGATYPLGTTTETWEVTDGVTTASCSFNVTVVDTPTVLPPFVDDTICLADGTVPIPIGTPSRGTYSGTAFQSSFSFDPMISGTGTFWLKYTDNQGCIFSDSTSITVVVCTGVNELNANKEFKIIPNPSNGIFKLQGSQKSQIREYQIYNTLGELVVDQTTIPNNNNIDLSDQPNGVYILQLRSSKGLQTYRLVKK